MIRLCNVVQLEYFGFLWNYFQSTLLPLSCGFLEWETTWITKLKKSKRFLILHLKIIHMTERTGSSHTMLSAVCRSPHFDGPTFRMPGDGWQWTLSAINNPQNLALKVEGKWGSRAWCTIRNSSSSSSLPSKYFSWGLTLHSFWLGKDHDHILSFLLFSRCVDVVTEPEIHTV